MPSHRACPRSVAVAAALFFTTGIASPAAAQNPGIETAARAFWAMPPQPSQARIAPPVPIGQAPFGQGEFGRASFAGAPLAPTAYHHHLHHRREAAALPLPVVENVVESVVAPGPFPYGYFGVSGTRHWQRHFGYRKAYTQWTLK